MRKEESLANEEGGRCESPLDWRRDRKTNGEGRKRLGIETKLSRCRQA